MLGFESEYDSFEEKRVRGRKEGEKDDTVGKVDIDEMLFQQELNDGGAKMDARHLRVRPEEMRRRLEEEGRQAKEKAAQEQREAQGRRERAQKVVERYREEDRAASEQKVREDAWQYAQQKAREERREREHPELKHHRELAVINAQLTELIAAQREQKKDFWSFMPSKRRARAKLDEEIEALKTKERVERMRIAELTGEYHRYLRGKRTKEALKPFFDTLRKPEKPPLTPKEEAQQVDITGELIRGLYKEKAQLQADREKFSMLFRPFRRYEIETRLEQIADEIRNLQQEVRQAGAKMVT